LFLWKGFGFKLNELIGVYNISVETDFDKVDKSKYFTDSANEGHDDFEDTLLGFAHHKVVNTKCAKEQADKNHNELVLSVKTVRVVILLNSYTAVKTNFSVFGDRVSAIIAKFITITCLNSAF
jgi:hypothetical protein